jgi:predicted RecA/RadA family phage recombinase
MLNPVATTAYTANRFKFSDGASVLATVPESSDIKMGQIVKLDGFIGFAMEDVKTGDNETAEVALRIAPDVYETDQVTAADDFAKGDLCYWDDTNKKLTTVSAEMVGPVGKVVVAKDANSVIEVLWLPQV